MKKIFFKIILILIFTFATLYAEEDLKIEITTNTTGNLFYDFEPILISTKVHIKMSDPRYAILKTKITNYENVVVSENSVLVNKITAHSPEEPFELLFEEPLPNLPVGYYTYKGVFEDKNKKAEKFIKFAIIKKPIIKDVKNSPFAIDSFLSWRFSNPEDVKTASELIKKIGIYFVRDRMSWDEIEKEKGKFDFGRYDKTATIQSESGLKILQVFHDTPTWASSRKNEPLKISLKYPPSDLRDVYDFLYKTATVFKGKVDYYEIWNEFDLPIFFLGKAEEYAGILKTAYIAIKNADSSAKVLFGSTTFGSGEIVWGDETFYDEEADIYIEKVFECGANYFFDIFNMHHYGPADGLTNKIARNKKILEKYSGKEKDAQGKKDIWLTEMGSTSTKKMREKIDESEILQAEYLVKAYTLGISGGLKKFFYFCFPNFVEHNSSFWGVFQIDEDGWQPKPAYVALANLINTLSDSEYVGRIETVKKENSLTADTEALVFRKKKSLIIVAWNKTDKDSEFRLIFKEPQELLIQNLWGNEKKIQTDPQIKTLSLKLSQTPIFILGIDEKQLVNKIVSSNEVDYCKDAMHSKERIYAFPALNDIMREIVIDLRCDKEGALPGEFVEVYANLYNFSNRVVEGIFGLSFPDDFSLAEGVQDMPVSIKPKERLTKVFHLISPKSIAEGEYKIKGDLLLPATNKIVAPGICYLKIAEPIKILGTKVIPYNQDIVNLEIRIKGNVTSEVSGKIYINPPQGWDVLKEYKDGIVFKNIKKNQVLAGSIKIKKSDPRLKMSRAGQWQKSYNNQYEIIAEINSKKYSKKERLETNAIYKSRGDINIDGDLNDWTDASVFIMDNFDNYVIGRENVKSPEDLKGKFYWSWDESNLYFSAEITDSDFKNDYYTENPWTGDAVELFLDMRGKETLGYPYYDENVYQIFIVPVTTSNQQTFFKVWQPTKKEFIGVECAFKKTKDGYIIEAKIPSINFEIDSFQPDREIGVEVTLDDIDSGDVQHRQMVWRGSPENWRDASNFQKMTLTE